MDFFDVLTFVGGLALFLYGMQVLGDGLSKASGGRMEKILERLTSNRYKAVLLGAVVTAIIQSSSATTVMVVGFVNSGIMKLSQAIGVIMGANIGTTVTSWILSLSGIESGNFFVKLLKPSSFSPVLALIGVFILLFSGKEKRKNIALILVGFAVLMFGMETMTGAVRPLADVPEFTNLLLLFSNPILGLLTGVLLTAVIQSSSASIGILQALCATGAVSYQTAMPIIMGQNIGTCVTALISSIGASIHARRAAIVHLYFNLIGTVVFMILFYGLHSAVDFVFMGQAAAPYGIALAHSIFNIFSTVILLPFSVELEKLACLTVRERSGGHEAHDSVTRLVDRDVKLLDDRFLQNPALAMAQCRRVALHMAVTAKESYLYAIDLLYQYDVAKAEEVSRKEEDCDCYEDMVGAYLMKLNARHLSEKDSQTLMLFLESIGDFERISDHAVGIKEAYQRLQDNKKEFSNKAKVELDIFSRSVADMLTLTLEVFEKEDALLGREAESLLRVVTELGAEIRKRHIKRLRKGKCTISLGFLLTDIITAGERVAMHCSHIALSAMEAHEETYSVHGHKDMLWQDEAGELQQLYHSMKDRYVLP